MSSRDAILASIRSNLPKLDRPLPALPKFDDVPPADLTEAFGKALARCLERMGRRAVVIVSGGLSHYPATPMYPNWFNAKTADESTRQALGV